MHLVKLPSLPSGNLKDLRRRTVPETQISMQLKGQIRDSCVEKPQSITAKIRRPGGSARSYSPILYRPGMLGGYAGVGRCEEGIGVNIFRHLPSVPVTVYCTNLQMSANKTALFPLYCKTAVSPAAAASTQLLAFSCSHADHLKKRKTKP